MKKLLLILICLFVFSCSDKQDISCIDLVKSGQTIKKKFESKSFDGECVKFDDMGKLTERKSYNNGVLRQKITYNQTHIFSYPGNIDWRIVENLKEIDGNSRLTPKQFEFDECIEKFNSNVVEKKCKVSIVDRRKLDNIYCNKTKSKICENNINLELNVSTRTQINNNSLVYQKIEYKKCEVGGQNSHVNVVRCLKGVVLNKYSINNSCKLHPKKIVKFDIESFCEIQFPLSNCPPKSYEDNLYQGFIQTTWKNKCRLDDITYCSPPDWNSIGGYKDISDPKKSIGGRIFVDQENGDEYCNTDLRNFDYDYYKKFDMVDIEFDSYPGNLEGLTEESIIGIGSIVDYLSKDMKKENMSYDNIEKQIKKHKDKYNIK